MSKTIKDRLYRRPETFPGQKNFPPNPTIPGQEFTVQEIVRQYTRGVKPLHHYIGEDFSQFQTMSHIDKVDYLKNLARENSLARYRVQEELTRLRNAKEEETIRARVIEEMRQKPEQEQEQT